jgi:hypothetical protein
MPTDIGSLAPERNGHGLGLGIGLKANALLKPSLFFCSLTLDTIADPFGPAE